jgi:dimethylamine/trimethylamine dehydrogenase
VAADAAVLVTQRLSCAELYNDLTGQNLGGSGIEGVYRIGDCVAPRLLADAIFDGHRLGREIDSSGPGIPLPYRRERLVVAR